MSRPARIAASSGFPPLLRTSLGILLEKPHEIARGYMGRRAYYPGPVVFLIDPSRPMTFWMHNTPLPLDIVFVDVSGVVTRVAYGEPYSDRPIPSDGAVRFVIEVQWKTAAWWGFVRGGRVIVGV